MLPDRFSHLHPPYHPPTFAVPTQYLGRFMFGFRLKAKPEHEAAQVLSWYGEGTKQVLIITLL